MKREDLLALKLQMGINPAAKIDPGILLAMWQQLNIECNGLERTGKLRAQRHGISIPARMTSTPIDV
ncbi:MAG: hypothetical protein WBS20_15385 [Lysobacterales bacterium]